MQAVQELFSNAALLRSELCFDESSGQGMTFRRDLPRMAAAGCILVEGRVEGEETVPASGGRGGGAGLQ